MTKCCEELEERDETLSTQQWQQPVISICISFVHGGDLWSFVYKFLKLFFSCTMYVYNKEEEKRKKKKKLL
jgi:hypothetical protein